MTVEKVSQRIHQYEDDGTGVGTSLTTIATIESHQARASRVVNITVKNSMLVDFTEFVVSFRVTKNAPWVTVADAAGDFTSPSLPIRWSDGTDMTTLAAAASGSFAIEFRGIEAVRLQAKQSGGLGAPSVEVYYSMGN